VADYRGRSIDLLCRPLGQLLDALQRLVLILAVPGKIGGENFEPTASKPARLVSPPGAVLTGTVDEDY
jgi:hypothetical protein